MTIDYGHRGRSLAYSFPLADVNVAPDMPIGVPGSKPDLVLSSVAVVQDINLPGHTCVPDVISPLDFGAIGLGRLSGKNVQYQVRPVTRYIVTRYEYESSPDGLGRSAAGSTQKGPEYPNKEMAFEVATALCKQEHEQLGYPVGDERIKYPEMPGLMAQESK